MLRQRRAVRLLDDVIAWRTEDAAVAAGLDAVLAGVLDRAGD